MELRRRMEEKSDEVGDDEEEEPISDNDEATCDDADADSAVDENLSCDGE